jgi:hypothetical protein
MPTWSQTWLAPGRISHQLHCKWQSVACAGGTTVRAPRVDQLCMFLSVRLPVCVLVSDLFCTASGRHCDRQAAASSHHSSSKAMGASGTCMKDVVNMGCVGVWGL